MDHIVSTDCPRSRSRRVLAPSPTTELPREACEWCGREVLSARVVEVVEGSGFVARVCSPCAQEEEAAAERAQELELGGSSFDEFRTPWGTYR